MYLAVGIVGLLIALWIYQGVEYLLKKEKNSKDGQLILGCIPILSVMLIPVINGLFPESTSVSNKILGSLIPWGFIGALLAEI